MTFFVDVSNGLLIAAHAVCCIRYDYPLCATAMKLMIRAYGTETGNLALQYLPFGGMYITQALILKVAAPNPASTPLNLYPLYSAPNQRCARISSLESRFLLG